VALKKERSDWSTFSNPVELIYVLCINHQLSINIVQKNCLAAYTYANMPHMVARLTRMDVLKVYLSAKLQMNEPRL